MKIDFSQKPLMLAPLAGYTDLPFRSVVKKFGADITVSEMISSNALAYDNQKTLKMITRAPNESPYSVQLAGDNPDIFKKAVEILNRVDGIDIIDLNCGCPAPKVANHGSGSGLLLDLDRMQKILDVIRTTSNKPYMSVKMRLGFNEKIHTKIAKACEESGADFIVVHGRTRKDAYKGKVDYHAIADVKDSVRIPVIANGDITDPLIAQKVFALTHCDGIMIGRGAIGRPWIFHQIKTGECEVSMDLKRDICLEHFDSMVTFHGEWGVYKFRKHLHTYSKGIAGASAFRQKINTLSDPVLVREVISEFFTETVEA